MIKPKLWESMRMTKKYSEVYKTRLISGKEAAGLIKSGDRLHLGGAANIAAVIDKHLAERVDELENIRVNTYLDTIKYKICEADPEGKVFNWFSGFLLGAVRPLSKQRGVGVYVPETWHTAPMIYREKYHFNFFFVVTSPMDANGYFHFGLTSGHNMAISDVSDKIVVIVREDMPVINGGYEESLHIDSVDYIVEDNEFQTFCLPPIQSKPEDRMIAENILKAGLIKDGSTLQIGIGGLPNAVLDSVASSGIKKCGLHTEMLTSKMVDLIEHGVVTNSEKTEDRFKTVFTFCLGDRALYDYADRNAAFAMYPVDYTNHPFVIARQPNMFSLNSAINVDLTGQVASEQMVFNGRPYQISGSGGQLDFVMGTMMSLDRKGVSVLSLYSTYKGTSRILPLLETGSNITVPRTLTQYVATEWGIVNLRGLSNTQRAEALISIAHPDFREELSKKAYEMGLISYSSRKEKNEGIVFTRE